MEQLLAKVPYLVGLSLFFFPPNTLIGTFNELMSKLDFSELIGQHVDLSVEGEHPEEEGEKKEEKEEEEAKEKESDKKPIDEPKKPEQPASDGKLTKAEAQKAGGVTSDSYKQYIWNGGTAVAILVLLFHIASQSANVVSFWWLTYWTSHPNNDAFNTGIYAMLVGYVIFQTILKGKQTNALLVLCWCFALYVNCCINRSLSEHPLTSTTSCSAQFYVPPCPSLIEHPWVVFSTDLLWIWISSIISFLI